MVEKMKKLFIIKSVDEMIVLGKKIGSLAEPNMVITLKGDLGAGKTVLTKGIGLGLGITAIINSPTFTLMKIYFGRLTLYHLDVYRLEGADDDFDLEEYFEKDGLSVIEWAQNIQDILPAERLEVVILLTSENYRQVQIQAIGERYEKLLRGLI